jgi:glutamate synthase (NADPH/NADH) small chain
LPSQNKVNAGDKVKGQPAPDGKHVIVIVAVTPATTVWAPATVTAQSATQFELMPQPPEERNRPMTWPYWVSRCAHLPATRKDAGEFATFHQGVTG